MTQAERSPFARALLAATLESFEEIPAEEELDARFSPAFEKKIKRIGKKTSGDTYRPVTTAMRRAILIAAIIAALAITAMAVPSVREAVIQFFIRNAGTHYEFSFDPEQAATAPKQIEKAYKPMYIPEGFTAETPILTTGVVSYTWFSTRFSEIGDYICFNQGLIPAGVSDVITNAEGVETHVLNLNGYEVFCVYDYGVLYHWTDNEYFYQLYCDPGISEEERNAIFYSITVDETAALPD